MGKVLIACEYSGIVRDAFIAAGHDTISCDLLPTERPGPHIQGDVRDLLQRPWDLVIAHPPCSYLTQYTWAFKNQERGSFKGDPGRAARWWAHMPAAIEFFHACLQANAPMVAVENPPLMHPPARKIIGPPDQRTDFKYFGDPVRKAVGWWLSGLPPLMAQCLMTETDTIVYDHKSKALMMRDPVKRLGLYGNHRHKERALFYPGMAAAMAKQWGCFLPA